MCEILTIKGNNKDVKFTKYDIQQARQDNYDGAGYVIFERNKDKWEIFDFETFGASPNPNYCLGKYGYSDMDFNEQDTNAYQWKKKKQRDDYAVKRMFKKQKELTRNQLMICHFRLATSGFGDVNTQPILKSDYLVIHNGIFNFKMLPSGMSDTRYFTQQLQKTAKNKKVRTVTQEKKAIKQMLNYAGGSYSIFIYSYRTKKLYYHKSQMTTFSKSYDGILGSTIISRFPIIFRPSGNGLVVI